jgi:hypothetical protein
MSICTNCVIDSSRCKSHNTRPFDAILSGIRDTHAAWVALLEGRPEKVQAECNRVTAAADAAVQAIRAEEADLKQQLQRVFVDELDDVIREQADVEFAAASSRAAVADSEESRCLLAAATREPRPPPPGAGGEKFEVAAAVPAVRGGHVAWACCGSFSQTEGMVSATSTLRRRTATGYFFSLGRTIGWIRKHILHEPSD